MISMSQCGKKRGRGFTGQGGISDNIKFWAAVMAEASKLAATKTRDKIMASKEETDSLAKSIPSQDTKEWMELCILGILMVGVADELLNSRVVAHIRHIWGA
jgi:hypothetical protein